LLPAAGGALGKHLFFNFSVFSSQFFLLCFFFSVLSDFIEDFAGAFAGFCSFHR